MKNKAEKPAKYTATISSEIELSKKTTRCFLNQNFSNYNKGIASCGFLRKHETQKTERERESAYSQPSNNNEHAC